MISFLSSDGILPATMSDRIFWAFFCNNCTSLNVIDESNCAIGLRRLFASIKSQNACAVVAKPLGTAIPFFERLLIISPNDAFLPPTSPTSCMPISLKKRIYCITKLLLYL